VHQLTDEEKSAVSQEVKAAAKEMAKASSSSGFVLPSPHLTSPFASQKALEKKLKEINISESDLQMYLSYVQAVSQQVV